MCGEQCNDTAPHLPSNALLFDFNGERKLIFAPRVNSRNDQTNCAADHGLAVMVFALCSVVVLCCRCACVCINVRVVIYGNSRQCGHYCGNPGYPAQPSGRNSTRLSEEEDSATPPLHKQEEHFGETQVTAFHEKQNTSREVKSR